MTQTHAHKKHKQKTKRLYTKQTQENTCTQVEELCGSVKRQHSHNPHTHTTYTQPLSIQTHTFLSSHSLFNGWGICQASYNQHIDKQPCWLSSTPALHLHTFSFTPSPFRTLPPTATAMAYIIPQLWVTPLVMSRCLASPVRNSLSDWENILKGLWP